MSTLRTSVEEMLRLEDIESLIESGAPDDEYDSEAAEIAEALNALKGDRFTEDNIISIVAHVWAKMFNLDEDDIKKRMPAFQNVAQRLLLARNPR